MQPVTRLCHLRRSRLTEPHPAAPIQLGIEDGHNIPDDPQFGQFDISSSHLQPAPLSSPTPKIYPSQHDASKVQGGDLSVGLDLLSESQGFCCPLDTTLSYGNATQGSSSFLLPTSSFFDHTDTNQSQIYAPSIPQNLTKPDANPLACQPIPILPPTPRRSRAKQKRHKGPEYDIEKPDLEVGRQPFGCPYWKRNPTLHSACFKPSGFKRISDVKQHLDRRHSLKTGNHCKIEYVGDNKCKVHQHKAQVSGLGGPKDTRLEYVSTEQKSQLRVKVERNINPADQWFEIWDILFSDPHPASPYIINGSSEEMLSFNKFLENQGFDMLCSILTPILTPFITPADLRTNLESGYHVVYDAWSQQRGLNPAAPSTRLSTPASDDRPNLPTWAETPGDSYQLRSPWIDQGSSIKSLETVGQKWEPAGCPNKALMMYDETTDVQLNQFL